MGEVKHRRRARDPFESARVAPGGGLQVDLFDRHGVDLLQRQRRVLEQALAQMREVAIRIACGGDALVHLHHLHAAPRNVLVREHAQHPPGRAAAADRHDEPAPRRDRRARVGGDHPGGVRGDRVGVGEHLGLDEEILSHARKPGANGARAGP